MTSSNSTAETEVTTANDSDYKDTFTLLQEEIARLESELRLRDETAQRELEHPPIDDSETVRRLDARITELQDELASREDTIAFLLDQLVAIEQSTTAERAEWEQLSQWVNRIEERVDSKERDSDSLLSDLEAARAELANREQFIKSEQRAWDAQRLAWTREVEELRSQITNLALQSTAHSQRSTNEADETDTTVLRVMEEENRRLRQTCFELTKAVASTAELDELRAEAELLRGQLKTAQEEARKLSDEGQRVKLEHETAIAAIKTQKAREAVVTVDTDLNPKSSLLATTVSDVSIDERIRAFRQHLQEVHQREEDERTHTSLTTKLSKLWHKSRPIR